MRFLLDTNTCIRLLRGDLRVRQRLAGHSPADCAISVIASYELYTGVEKCTEPERELLKVERLLRTVSRLDFNQDHARAAAAVRARLESVGLPIGPYDVLLAGQALAAGLTLVTANTGEFQRVDGLSIENWQA